MRKTLTIADIAEALHLSRNTVSKALNGKHVSPKTRQLILDTAIHMGYKSFDLISSSGAEKGSGNKILILSSVPLLTANYYIYLIRGIMAEAERRGLEILQYVFHVNSEFETVRSYIRQFEVDGIICIEFFNRQMADNILSLNIPTVFMDICEEEVCGEYDVILSENSTELKKICFSLAAAGAKNFSFVGYPHNCKGFYERYMALRSSLLELNLNFDQTCSILRDNSFPYGSASVLEKFYLSLSHLPDVIVCANDFIALTVIDALKQCKRSSLKKVNIIGFDNIPESRLHTPRLSTINIDKQALGKQAVNTILERIDSPHLPSRYIYLKNNVVIRETTPSLVKS